MERLLKDAQKISGVKYDIKNLSDVYSAIHVIQGELGITGATADEASRTLSGSFSAMKAAASDLMANLALGRDIGPSLAALSETVFTYLENLMPAIGQILKGLPDVLVEALSMAVRGMNIAGRNAGAIAEEGVAVVIKLAEAVVSAVPYLVESAWGIVAALGQTILSTDWVQLGNDMMARLKESMDIAAGEILGTDGNIVESVLNAVRAGLPQVLSAGETIVMSIIDGIVQYAPEILENGMQLLADLGQILIDGLPQYLEIGENIVNALVDGVVETAPGLLDSALDLCTEFIGNLLENLPAILETGKEMLLKLVDGIRILFPKLLESAGDAVAELLDGIITNLPDILQAGFSLITELISGIGEAAPDIYDAIGELINKLWNVILETDWLQLGKDIINGLIKGIGQMHEALWEAAKSIAKSALNAIKKALGIASPSKVMAAEVGKFIPAGVAVGVTANTKPLTDAMDSLADMSTDALKTDLDVSHDVIKMTGTTSNTAGKAARDAEGKNDAILDALEEIAAKNAEVQNATVELLRDILEAVLGIHIGDGDVFEAVERYKRKQTVAIGGAGW